MTPGTTSIAFTENDRLEIEGVIRDAIGWAVDKNKQRLFSIMAQDGDFFIFHPDSNSTIVGFEAFKELAERAWMKPEFQAVDFTIKELKINPSLSGSVTWFSAYLDDHALWKGQPIGWDNARWTGILEKREDHWVIVQMHFSLPNN